MSYDYDDYKEKLESHISRYDEAAEPERCGVGEIVSTEDPDFQSACAWHDKAYSTSSWAENHLTREQVDRKFLEMMLLIAGWNPFKRARAYFYYWLARAFGAQFWEGKL